jgi:hypothetical protein
VGERTFAWRRQSRWLRKDSERLAAASEATIYGALCRPKLPRLTRTAA